MTRRQVWPVLSILVGATFAIEAIAHASGTVFAVTAVLTGTIYALAGTLSRPSDGRRARDRSRRRRG